MSLEGEAVLIGGAFTPRREALADGGGADTAHVLEASVLIAGDLCLTAGASLPSPGRPVPWAGLVPEIQAHDLALVNLECPLTSRPRRIDKSGPALCGDPDLARVIADGGFSGVTLANNHVRDAGGIGVEDTISACEKAGLVTVGAGVDLESARRPLIVDAAGLRIGIVACAEREFSIADRESPGAAPLDPWVTPGLVRDAAERADAVVVILHGGNEFASTPRPGLVAACRALVDAGALAVVCHHSHVPGPVEAYRGAPIFYGTGNFLFPTDVAPSQAWHVGYAASLVVKAGGVVSFRLLPYDQCLSRLAVRPMREPDEADFAPRMLCAAEILANPDSLASAWEAHCYRMRRHYLYVALGLTRIERRLLRYGIWPEWRRGRRRLTELLGVLSCESHREALELVLQKENRR